MALTSKQLIKAINNVEGLKARSYSGRYMFGRTCVAFTTDSVEGSATDIVQENRGISGLRAAFKAARHESLGLRQIVYFPDYEWVEQESDSE